MATSSGAVTDPALIAQLEAQAAAPQGPAPVTDPDMIAKLEAASGGTPPEQPYDFASDLKHKAGMTARILTNAVTAIPLMAMDTGVNLRNGFGHLTGIGGENYTLPSTDVNAAMDHYFGTPQNTVEKATDIAGPMVLGAGASKLPGAVGTILGGPTPKLGTTMGGLAGEEAPDAATNFLSAAERKRQMLINALKQSQDLGLVVPRATTNPTLLNQAVETIGSKVGTAQHAAVHNQEAANKVSAEYIGLDPDLPLTSDAVKAVRSEAGKDYQAVRKVGNVNTDDTYLDRLGAIEDRHLQMEHSFPGTPESPILDEIGPLTQGKFNANAAMDMIDRLRSKGSEAYASGDHVLGADYKALGTNLEDQIDRHISQPGSTVSPDLVQKFRDARTLIAKTHTIEDALQPNGDVSISKLASMKKGGEYMTGDVSKLADFGNTFKKAAQSPAAIGSAGVNHLEGGLTTLATIGGGLLGGHAGHGAEGMGAGAALGMAIPVARRVAVARALSPGGQASAIPALQPDFFSTKSPKSAAALAQALSQFSAGSQQ